MCVLWHIILWIRVCVWQLVNLMHAINYVVSLTDGARVSQAKIETEDIFAACQYDFSNIMCEFFFISFFVTRTAPHHTSTSFGFGTFDVYVGRL